MQNNTHILNTEAAGGTRYSYDQVVGAISGVKSALWLLFIFFFGGVGAEEDREERQGRGSGEPPGELF